MASRFQCKLKKKNINIFRPFSFSSPFPGESWHKRNVQVTATTRFPHDRLEFLWKKYAVCQIRSNVRVRALHKERIVAADPN